MRRAGARPQVAALVLACLLAALLAGCGGGKGGTTSTTTTTTTTAAAAPLGKAAYVREMTRIGHGLSSDINAIGSPTSGKKAAASLTKAQAEVRAAERKLAAIVPPPAVKAAHRRLTRAVANFAQELDPVIAELAGRPPDGARAADVAAGLPADRDRRGADRQGRLQDQHLRAQSPSRSSIVSLRRQRGDALTWSSMKTGRPSSASIPGRA